MDRPTSDSARRAGLEGYLSAQMDQAVTITELRRPTATGFSADTMIVDIEWAAVEPSGQESDRLVVQAAPTGPRLFDHYDLARTFAVQRELAAFDVPVAPMRWLCEDLSWIGTPFYVMDFVDGLVPPDRPPYHVQGWLSDCPESERSSIWTAGVQAIGALHNAPVDKFSFLGTGTGTDLASDRIEDWQTFGHDLGPDNEPALIVALEALSRSRPQTGNLRVHWGDAKLGNMMFAGSRVAAILDWELCGLGVGEEDLAHWMAVDWFLSAGIDIDRLPGLPGPTATIAGYEAVVGRQTTDVEWWFVFALVRMGLIFQRAAVQSRRRNEGSGRLRSNAIVPHLERLLDGTVWAGYEAHSSHPP